MYENVVNLRRQSHTSLLVSCLSEGWSLPGKSINYFHYIKQRIRSFCLYCRTFSVPLTQFYAFIQILRSKCPRYLKYFTVILRNRVAASSEGNSSMRQLF